MLTHWHLNAKNISPSIKVLNHASNNNNFAISEEENSVVSVRPFLIFFHAFLYTGVKKPIGKKPFGTALCETERGAANHDLI